MATSPTYFLDTNVLVYAFERDATNKKQRARELIADSQPWQISWQVVQEFSNVSLHRFKEPLTQAYLNDLIDLLLKPHCSVYPDFSLWQSALQIKTATQYRFYDSLIIAAALRSGAEILYSEDLQHNRAIGDLKIINPFK
jgi:predicted nucleic acid-binding protein